ncbi:MAG: pimeloyl-ACP methyl ester carboxylesterase [Pseudohongiellaceae bacterium]
MVSSSYPFAPHHLDINGLKLHYVDEGSGAPLLMVHGNPSWSFLYRNLITALSGEYRCIAPDHMGCGRSDKPGDDRYEYTLQSRVDDLTRLVDSLELERVTLVVHDWGGMIGWAWAVQNPERVERLVLFNTGAFPLPKDARFPASLTLARTPGLGALLVRGFSAFSRGANKNCVTRRPMSAEVARGFLEPYDSWAHRIAVHRFVQDIPLKPGDRSWQLVAETAAGIERLVDRPALICWGLKDFVFDKHFLAEWEHRLPSAEVHRFDDAGHYVLEDAVEEILPLVSDFLQRHPLEALA